MVDVIVIGGGHAGIEAALAASRMEKQTTLITLDKEFIGHMPCNPSIGGPAKGIVVREIDALGGQMGKTIDKTFLQMKMLNLSKGPGVWSLRAQADKIKYPKMMQEIVLSQQNLQVLEAAVGRLIIKNNTCIGVELEYGEKILARTVIITTGTYLKSRILVGDKATPEGPDGQRTTFGISNQLRELGFRVQRLKTGTPPRVLDTSINYEETRYEPGMGGKLAFSFSTDHHLEVEKQEPCWLTYTNENTHKLILENIGKSSMYGAIKDIESKGPRYCPSIDDKVYRFQDKDRHQLFLEPESRELNSIYLQGLSSSLPIDIQDKVIRSIPGLKNCEIIKYAYAIEYDSIDPLQLFASLETKLIKNLFSAGQINGTSGYEEAAGQGLMAGINAALKVDGKEPLILRRDEAYIGVLIDDLVTKGTKEPYRLLTSRAEHRLLLRHDNADIRLRKYGISVGLLSGTETKDYYNKVEATDELLKSLHETRFTPKSKINEILSSKLTGGISAYELLRRPEVKVSHLLNYIDGNYNWQVLDQVEISVKFEGYIQKATLKAERTAKLEMKQIPADINYNDVKNLALEAVQKLTEIQPKTIGQASRISGISPADIEMLLVHLKQRG